MGHFYAPDEVFDLPVSGYAKLILLNLCLRANKAGSSFPSKNRIASDCGMSKRAVDIHLNELVDRKIVFKNMTTGKSNIYQLSDRFIKTLNSRSTVSKPMQEMHGRGAQKRNTHIRKQAI